MAIDGPLTVMFAIYDAKDATTAIWSEEHSLALDQGFYSVSLGSTVPIGDTVFDGSVRYFGITVADAHLTSRRLTRAQHLERFQVPSTPPRRALGYQPRAFQFQRSLSPRG